MVAPSSVLSSPGGPRRALQASSSLFSSSSSASPSRRAVDYDVDFVLTFTSDETDADAVATTVHQDLVVLFTPTAADSSFSSSSPPTVPFDALIVQAATDLGFSGSNMTVGGPETGAVNVLRPQLLPNVTINASLLVTASPTASPVEEVFDEVRRGVSLSLCRDRKILVSQRMRRV